MLLNVGAISARLRAVLDHSEDTKSSDLCRIVRQGLQAIALFMPVLRVTDAREGVPGRLLVPILAELLGFVRVISIKMTKPKNMVNCLVSITVALAQCKLLHTGNDRCSWHSLWYNCRVVTSQCKSPRSNSESRKPESRVLSSAQIVGRLHNV